MKNSSLKLIIASVSTCFLSLSASAQTINTIAGTGTAGYSGDGGAATSARINQPDWVSGDAAGNYYIADRSNNRIRKISPSGIITTIAGSGVSGYSGDGGPATAARLSGPSSIIVDATGNIYIADSYNHTVRKVSPSGIITTIAGTGVSGFSGDGGPATAATFNNPYGLVFDPSGNLIVADEMNNRIRKISHSGIVTTIAGTGIGGFSGDGGPATAAQLFNPHYICEDAAGNLYLMDNANHRVRKINVLGNISTVTGTGIATFSGDGGPATAAAINWASGMTVDASGNLYICDEYNNRIRVINSSGVISTFAGTGSSTFSGDGGAPIAAGMPGPSGIFIDGSGDIVLSEISDSRIRKITIVPPSNYPPIFVLGRADSLQICPEIPTVNIDYLLKVTDADAGQTLTWSVAIPPSVGSVSASYSTTSTGGMVTTSGATYTPPLGYIGNDSFVVQVSDGFLLDSITIYVHAYGPPVAGVITGPDTVCVGSTITLSDAMGGGVWLVYDSSSLTVNSAGIVTGIASGLGSVMYSVTNYCGTASASYNVWVNTLPSPGTIAGADSVCPGDTIMLSETTSGGVWSVDNASIATVNSAGVVTGGFPGNATVYYSVTNTCGTASVNHAIVTKSNCKESVADNLGEGNVSVFPNPSNGDFVVTLPSSSHNAQIRVTNLVGQQVATFSNKGTSNTISCHFQGASGLYILEISDEHSKVIRRINLN